MKSLFDFRNKLLGNGRKRGFTLIEIVLVLAVGLGLIVGGIVFFQQAQASSDVTDKTRTAVGISSEVRAQARTLASFDAITSAAGTKDGVSYTAVASGANVKTNAIILASAIPAHQFNNLAIAAAGQDFTLTFTSLNPTVCNRLSTSDLGPNSESDASDCDNGELVVTYSR